MPLTQILSLLPSTGTLGSPLEGPVRIRAYMCTPRSKEPCPYHQGPVKHTLEECVMLRCYFHKAGPPAEDGKGQGNKKKEGGKE
jgi:hypothetical protein